MAEQDTVRRELAAIRRRAETRQTVPAADALRLCRALESVLHAADWAADIPPFSVPPLRANGVHVREHADWTACDCPGSIPIMWPLDPDKVREAVARELTREAATAAGAEGESGDART